VTQTAFYLAAGSHTVMCLAHEPPSDVAVDASGIVICPPIGWDEVASYRGRRVWAQELAAAGHRTVRLDLPGTGDSSGTPRDPKRVEAWTAAIAAAAGWLRTSGCDRVTVVGLGLGGLLACRAVAGGAPVDDLVLWGTPSRGRAAVRQLRAFARLETAEFDVPDVEPPVDAFPDVLEASGFAFSAETLGDLETLDVTELDLAGAGRRALLLRRDGLRVDARLRAHLEECGVAVTEEAGDGWATMAPTEPIEARVPSAVLCTVRAWLTAGPDGSGRPGPTAVVAARELVLDGGVRERPFTLARPYGSMFGVLAEPDDASEVIAVLLNPGAIRRTGPNRMWVELARRWASRGVTTLRVDVEGIGDADGAEGRYADVSRMYGPHLVDETVAVLDALAADRPGARFVLVGLCSGASWGFHAARRRPDVSCAILLNPRQLFYDPLIDVRRLAVLASQGVTSPARLGRLLRGRVRPSWAWRLARSAVVSMFQRRAYHRALARATGELEDAFDELHRAERRVVLVFSEGEPLLAELRVGGFTDQLERWPELELEIIRGPGHTFRPLWSQQAVHGRVDRALDEVLSSVPLPAAPTGHVTLDALREAGSGAGRRTRHADDDVSIAGARRAM
jgi:pimeloyl-ACP methyl ester carboxylesterase